MATKSLGALIDKAHELREKQRAAQKVLDGAKQALADAKQELLEALNAQGIEQSRGKLATATITETEVPQVDNWEAFYRFIKRNNAFFLLERRPAAAAWREMTASRKGRPIPGTQSFTKRDVSLRVR